MADSSLRSGQFVTIRFKLHGMHSLSVVMLFLENHWSSHGHLNEANIVKPTDIENDTCESDKLIIEPCVQCSKFEKKTASPYCEQTGYKEKVKCSNKTIYQSCLPSPEEEERKFWIFESITLVVSIVTYGIVFARQKLLDKQLMEKINKQIAAGI